MKCMLPPGSASAVDLHTQDEIVIVLSGEGKIRVGDDTAAMSSGEMIVIPRSQDHLVDNDGEEPLEWLAFYWPLREAAPGDER
jgi:mannose-6-phosphate isomerase-like protein (cupin superfamily)